MTVMGRQDGDTLVEVILSIALVSVVLVAAFNIAGASFRSAMLAKERIEAVSLAQQQAERLRALRDRDMVPGQQYTAFATFPTSGEILNSNLDKIACGSGCKLSPQDLYTISMTQVPNSVTGTDAILRTYQIKVEWEQIGGGGTNETIIEYKLADKDTKSVGLDCSVVESCF